MLYKRGRIWWVKVKRQPYGEIRRSSKSTKKSIAARLEREIYTQLEQEQENRTLGRRKRHMYDEALSRWVESCPASWLPKIEQNKPYFDGTVLDEAVINANIMRQDLLKKRLSPCTINRRLAVVKRVLNLAYREYNMLDQPLAEKIKLESEKGTQREVYLDKEQFNTLFNHIKPSRQSADYSGAKAALVLMVLTGLRKSEVLRLEPEDWRKPMLIVRQSKSGKPRSIPVAPLLHDICDSLPIQATETQLRYWWDKARKEAKMESVRMHDLRHTFASWYANDPDATLVQLRDLLGHSNLAVTSRYAHLIDDKIIPPAVSDGVDVEI